MANKAQIFSVWSVVLLLSWILLGEVVLGNPSVGVIAIWLVCAGMQTLSIIYNLLKRIKYLEEQIAVLRTPPAPSNANPTTP